VDLFWDTVYMIFSIFLSEFCCHGNTLCSLENSDSTLSILAQNWNQCNFGLFLLKFGCHGNSLWSLKNSDSILIWICRLLRPYNSRKKFRIFYTKLKFVLFWLIFAQTWLPWQRPLLPENFRWHIWILQPRKPYHVRIIVTISCTELKFMHFWLFICPI